MHGCAQRVCPVRPLSKVSPFKLRDGNEPVFRAILCDATTVARRGPSNNGEEIRTDLNFDFKRLNTEKLTALYNKNKQITR